MSSRRVVAILILTAWVLLGPVAMAFSGCGSMGAMCEGTCASACAIVDPSVSSVPALASPLELARDREPPANTPTDLEHPPKSLRSA